MQEKQLVHARSQSSVFETMHLICIAHFIKPLVLMKLILYSQSTENKPAGRFDENLAILTNWMFICSECTRKLFKFFSLIQFFLKSLSSILLVKTYFTDFTWCNKILCFSLEHMLFLVHCVFTSFKDLRSQEEIIYVFMLIGM